MEEGTNEFRIIQKLGEGSFADVYKVISLRNQKVYAEKRLKKRYRSFEEACRLMEVNALRILSKHPNIINLYSVMYDSESGHVALIFELVEMNLLEFMTKSQRLDEKTVLLLIYQLTKAIAYVHSKGIFHRDVKPENCLVNSQTLELKLADFGSVSSIANRTKFTEYVATRWYRAPECILTAGAYGPPVDIWAIGCILFEALTGRPLFPGKHQIDQLNKIHAVLGTPSRDVLAQFQENATGGFAFPQKPKQNFRNLLVNASDDVIDLLEKMVVYDPTDRITAEDALKHPAFAEIYQKDQEWQTSDKSVPFPVYATQDVKPPKQSVSFGNVNVAPSAHVGESAKITGPDKPVCPPQQPEPQAPAKPAPLITQVKGRKQINPSDARRRAAQRILEYNKRVANQPKPVQPKVAFGSSLKLGPAFGAFQKPRPEMLQPRLPPIAYQPLKKF